MLNALSHIINKYLHVIILKILINKTKKSANCKTQKTTSLQKLGQKYKLMLCAKTHTNNSLSTSTIPHLYYYLSRKILKKAIYLQQIIFTVPWSQIPHLYISISCLWFLRCSPRKLTSDVLKILTCIYYPS